MSMIKQHKVIFLPIVLALAMPAYAIDGARCTALEGLMKDTQKKELNLKTACSGASATCNLFELQKKYNSLQAQNVLYTGVINLINGLKGAAKNLHEAKKGVDKQADALDRIENGMQLYSSLEALSGDNAFNQLKAMQVNLGSGDPLLFQDKDVIQNLKSQFCIVENASHKSLCDQLKDSRIAFNTDGSLKIDAFDIPVKERLPLLGVIGFTKNYYKIADNDKQSSLSKVKYALNDDKDITQKTKLDDVKKMKAQAILVYKELSCIEQLKLKPTGVENNGLAPGNAKEFKLGPSTTSQSIDFGFSANNQEPQFNANVDVGFTNGITVSGDDPNCKEKENLSIDKRAEQAKIEIKQLNADIAAKIADVEGTANNQNKVFNMLSGKFLAEDMVKSLNTTSLCMYSVNCSDDKEGLLSDYNIERKTDEEFNLIYKSGINNAGILEDYLAHADQNSALMKLLGDNSASCKKSSKECYYEHLAQELKNLGCEAYSKEDLEKSHLKVNQCIEKLKAPDIYHLVAKNNVEIENTRKLLNAIYADPAYEQTSKLKTSVLAEWAKAGCGDYSNVKKVQTYSVNPDCSTVRFKTDFSNFVSSTGEVLAYFNDKVVREARSKKIDLNKSVICIDVEQSPHLKKLCEQNDFSLDAYGVASTNVVVDPNNNGANPNAGNTNPDVDNSNNKTKYVDNGNTSKTKKKKEKDRNPSSGAGDGTTGAAIGSGLISSLQYGMQTLGNFQNTKRFNDQMKYNALMVRSAQLNPAYLSWNQTPQNYYSPYAMTGAPLGSMNPYSSNFNYDASSYYYNTYNPLQGFNDTYNNNSGVNFENR